jgi:hypothetical protein
MNGMGIGMCPHWGLLTVAERDGQFSSAIHQHASATVPSVAEGALRVTKKGGIPGKKRGKYNKDSRVTLWRQKVDSPISDDNWQKAKEAGFATSNDPVANPDKSPVQSQGSTCVTTIQTPDFMFSGSILESEPLDVKQESQSSEIVTELKSMLAQVKNNRSKAGSLSSYEYLRHLSIARYIEWTEDGSHTEVDASRRLAELLWEHSRDPAAPRRSIPSSVEHKARLIKQWADEYRMTGMLREHAQGRHGKTESQLARDDIALAAQKALAKMKKPGPAALRDALVTTIFPEFGIDDLRISENTCRTYMEKWGWKTGKYREWVPRRKLNNNYEDSDEEDIVSDETAVLDLTTPKTPIIKPPAWNAPIPSPSRNTPSLPSHSSSTTMSAPVSSSLGDVHHSPPSSASPSTIYTDSTMVLPDSNQSQSLWSPQYPPWPTHAFIPDPTQRQQNISNHLQDATFSGTPQFSTPPQQYFQPRAYTGALSLDYLFPATPQTMGLRPVFNGAAPMTFVPPPSQQLLFAHDVSYPSQMARPVHDQQNGNSGRVSEADFLPNGNQ